MARNEVSKIDPTQITPEHVYLNRRNFIRAGLFAGTAVATGLTYKFFNPQPVQQTTPTTEIARSKRRRSYRRLVSQTLSKT
jgi:hypothetical protein